MAKILFFAEFKYGKPNLCRSKIVKETEKTFTVGDEEILLGNPYAFFFGRKTKKTKYKYFTNYGDALKYLIDEAKNEVDRLERELVEVKAAERTLMSMLADTY